MEIKGIYEAYKLRAATAPGGFGRAAQRTETLSAEKESGAQDTVAFSTGASFRASLDAEVKKYASAQELSAAGSERIAALREKYQGDCCPIAGSEVATAMLNTVFGKL